MNKKLILVAVASVISTLIVVAIVAAIALPRVIEQAKVAAVTNFDDEYQEIAYILDESKEPVIQPNYLITGLIMSPDFQEYLDQGVQKGWWTEEFLEQFLIDEALPIFFTNYHVLFSAIIGSDGVQETLDKLGIAKGKIQALGFTIQAKIGTVRGLLNSPTVNAIRGLDFNKINSDINALIAAINSIDTEAINDIINQLKAIDFDKIIATIEEIQEIDFDSIADAIKKIQEIDVEQLKAIIEQIKAIDFEQIKQLISDIKDLVDKIENGGFDGIIQDILENILDSDFVQGILETIDNAEDSLQLLVKLLTLYYEKVVDVEQDHNFFGDGTTPDTIVLPGGITIEVPEKITNGAWPRLLNALDIEIPADGFVYANQGTIKLEDDTFTIHTIYIGWEVDGEAEKNILTKPIVISGAKSIIISNYFEANLEDINDII